MLRHFQLPGCQGVTIDKFGADWTKPGNFVGNLHLSEWTPRSSLTMVKNPELLRRGQCEARQDRLLSTEDIAEEFQRLPRR